MCRKMIILFQSTFVFFMTTLCILCRHHIYTDHELHLSWHSKTLSEGHQGINLFSAICKESRRRIENFRTPLSIRYAFVNRNNIKRPRTWETIHATVHNKGIYNLFFLSRFPSKNHYLYPVCPFPTKFTHMP